MSNLEVHKNDVTFSIPATQPTILKWFSDHYTNWENETFSMINRFIDKEKILIDVGSWVGLLSIPYSYKFSNVIAVEADTEAIKSLKDIIEFNKINNISIVEKAVFNESGKKVFFGPSNFMAEFNCLNQSVSHIKYDQIKQNDYTIDTITLREITEPYLSKIGLIKIDIEGGEGNIFDDIEYLLEKNIPMFISFHYPWINNKERVSTFFKFIENNNIKCYDSDYKLITNSLDTYVIQNNQFTSILFLRD